MRDFPRFIRLGDDRINVDEIVAYGTKFFVDEDGEVDEDSECLYVEDEDDLGCSFDEKLVELDAIFLIAAHRPR